MAYLLEQKLNAAMRYQLDQKNQEFSQIRTTLSRHVNEAIVQNLSVSIGGQIQAVMAENRCQSLSLLKNNQPMTMLRT